MAQDTLRLETEFLAIYRDPNGKIAWVEKGKNTIVIEGLTRLLSVMFAAGTQVTSWYMGLINNSGFDEITQDDTIASHAGWTEFTSYSGGVRKQWTPLSVSGAVLTNTAPIQFTFSSAGTVQGFFLVSDSTLSGTTGVMWNAATFSGTRTIQAGGNLTVNYTLRAAGGS